MSQLSDGMIHLECVCKFYPRDCIYLRKSDVAFETLCVYSVLYVYLSFFFFFFLLVSDVINIYHAVFAFYT
jgi:hypothetical protein